MASITFGNLHITRIVIDDPLSRAHSISISIQGQKSTNFPSITNLVATDSIWSQALPLLPFTESEFVSTTLVFNLIVAKKESHLTKKGALKFTFPTLSLSNIVFGLSNDQNSSPNLLKAFTGSEEVVLSIYCHFSGKDYVNWQLREPSRTWEVIGALNSTKMNPSLVVAYVTHRPILERLVELTHECVTQSKLNKLHTQILSELWLFFGEYSIFPKIFDCLPEVSLYLLAILKEDKMAHLERYSHLYPVIRHGISFPVARKMIGFLIPLLEDSMTLSIKQYAESSVDTSSSNPNTEVKASKKSKKGHTMENTFLHCSGLVALLTFYDPKYCAYVATKTNVISLCKEILATDIFVLHKSAFSLIRWFGKAHIDELDHHGIFSLLNDRTTSPSYSSRLIDTYTLLELFGRRNTADSFEIICAALNSDLPPVQAKHCLSQLHKDLFTRTKLTPAESVLATDAVLKILTISTLPDAIDLLRDLYSSRRMPQTVFFQTSFLRHFCKAFVAPQGQLTAFAGIFKLFVLDDLEKTGKDRLAHIELVSIPLQEAGFWECLAACMTELSTLTPEFLRKNSRHWSFSSHCVSYLLQAALSLLTHGPATIIEPVFEAKFFDSLISFLPVSAMYFATIGDAYSAYIGFLHIIDRAITNLEGSKGDNLRNNFIAELLRHPLKNSVLTTIPNTMQYFLTPEDWSSLVKRYCDLDNRLEPFFAHFSVYFCRGLPSVASVLVAPFIHRFMSRIPKMKALEELEVAASEKLPQLFETELNVVKMGYVGKNSSENSHLREIDERPELPDVFEFFALYRDPSPNQTYFQVSKHLFALLSAALPDPNPLTLAWVAWHMEMVFSVLDSRDSLVALDNGASVAHASFVTYSVVFLTQWGQIMRKFGEIPVRLFSMSSWNRIWPHTTSRLLSIYQKDAWQNYSTANLAQLRSNYLSNFFASCPPMSLFDLVEDVGLALGLFEQAMEMSSVDTVKKKPFFVIMLSTVLDDSMNEFDPRFLSEMEKAWQVSKQQYVLPYEMRTMLPLGPLNKIFSSLTHTLELLHATQRDTSTSRLILDFNRCLVDMDIRYFTTLKILKLFDSVDIEAVIPTKPSVDFFEAFLYYLMMDPSDTLSSLALKIYKKVMDRFPSSLSRVTAIPPRIAAHHNSQLWACFAQRPSTALEWLRMQNEYIDRILNGNPSRLLVQYQACHLLLEYVSHLDAFAHDPSDWMMKMQRATLAYDKVVEERNACSASLPTSKYQVSEWISRKMAHPNMVYKNVFTGPGKTVKRREIFFAKILAEPTHFPADPNLALHAILEVIIACFQVLPNRPTHRWPRNTLLPRHGLAFVPHTNPDSLLPTTANLSATINLSGVLPPLSGGSVASTTASSSNGPAPASISLKPDAMVLFVSVGNTAKMNIPWLPVPDCMEPIMSIISHALTLLPRSVFPIDSNRCLSDFEPDELEVKLIKVEEMVIELICRIFSFSVSLEIRPDSGLLIPLKRHLTSFALSPEGRNFANNSVIGKWTEYLFCVTKTIVSRFIQFEDTLAFEITIRDQLASQVRNMNLFSVDRSENEMLLEILFMLVHDRWDLHERAVITDLESALTRMSGTMVAQGAPLPVRTDFSFLGRVLAFLALYRPGDPIPPDTTTNTTAPPVRPYLGIAYTLELDNIHSNSSMTSTTASSSSPSPLEESHKDLKASPFLNDQPSDAKEGGKSENKISTKLLIGTAQSQATIQSPYKIWSTAIYQLSAQSKQDLGLKSTMPSFYSPALYERLVAISSSKKAVETTTSNATTTTPSSQEATSSRDIDIVFIDTSSRFGGRFARDL